jgi:hypothetical protein
VIWLVIVLAVTTVVFGAGAYWCARDHAKQTARICELEAKNRRLTTTWVYLHCDRAIERMKRRTAEARLVLTERTLDRENETCRELSVANDSLAAEVAGRDHTQVEMRLAGRILPDLRDDLERMVFDDGGLSPIFDRLRDETWPLVVLPGELLADNTTAALEVALFQQTGGIR